MGIIYADVRNLLETFSSPTTGRRVITLGRLSVYVHAAEVTQLRKLCTEPRALEFWKTYRWGEFSERLFKEVFNCAVVDSLDVSDYQDATVIQDLQTPIPETLANRYDLVIDGGTLEHVFNVPVAMKNVLRLAAKGGMIYLNSPSNNLSGHGFYQFSPELMYRVLSEANGMQPVLNRIGIARFPSIEKSSRHRVYDVVDPDSVKSRVGLLCSRPVYLMVMARKIGDIEPFTSPVLQSDYTRTWSGATPPKSLKLRVLERLPHVLRALILGYREIFAFSLSNTRFYRRVW